MSLQQLAWLTTKKSQQTETEAHKPGVNSIICEYHFTYTANTNSLVVQNIKCVLHHSQRLIDYATLSVCTGTTILFPYLKSNHCSSFQYRASVDFIYAWTSSWKDLTTWQGNTIAAPVMSYWYDKTQFVGAWGFVERCGFMWYINIIFLAVFHSIEISQNRYSLLTWYLQTMVSTFTHFPEMFLSSAWYFEQIVPDLNHYDVWA